MRGATELEDVVMAGDLLKEITPVNVLRLIDSGVSVHAISEATGLAVTAIEDLTDGLGN